MKQHEWRVEREPGAVFVLTDGITEIKIDSVYPSEAELLADIIIDKLEERRIKWPNGKFWQ